MPSRTSTGRIIRFVRGRRRYKPTFYKKKTFRRKQKATSKKPSVHIFKRSFIQNIQLSNAAVPAGWTADGNAIYRNFEYTLNDLPSPTDFVNLFGQYKLNAVKQEIIVANTTTDDDNSQLMMWWDTKRDGQNTALTEPYFLTSQTAKHTILKPPFGNQIRMFSSLRQLSNTYKLTDDDYAIVKPRYISTNEPNTPHYGTSMRIERVDGRPFGTDLANFQYAKIITTVYLSCKKVQ
jgi:hypothetical protein